MQPKTIVVSALLIFSLITVKQTPTVESTIGNYAVDTATVFTTAYVNNEISFENAKYGVVLVRYESTKVLMVGIKSSNSTKEEFFICKSGEVNTYPLTAGDGIYTVTVYERVEGNNYRDVLTGSQTVVLDSEFAPYRRANFYADFSDGDAVSAAARSITEGKVSSKEKAAAIYCFLCRNLSYDREKAEQIALGELKGYVPSAQTTLETEKGVCCDFASLYAAMLRSVDVPCKVETGYCTKLGGTYHAWNRVYDEDHNEWLIIDITRGINSVFYQNEDLPAQNVDDYEVCNTY